MTPQKRRTIAVVDNEEQFFDDLKVLLANSRGTEDINLVYKKATRESTFDAVVDGLREVRGSLLAILLDVVLLQLGGPQDYVKVTELARRLRHAYPEVPILYVTVHLTPNLLPAVSWASLEDTDGVFFKQWILQDLEEAGDGGRLEIGASGDQYSWRVMRLSPRLFIRTLEQARQKREALSIAALQGLDDRRVEEDIQTVRSRFRPSARAMRQIERVGPTAFLSIAEELFDLSRVFVQHHCDYFRPGLSGAYLFLIRSSSEEGTEERLLKIGPTDKIEREAAHHKDLSEADLGIWIPAISTSSAVYGPVRGFSLELLKQSSTLGSMISDEYTGAFSQWAEALQQTLGRLWRSPGVFRYYNPWNDVARPRQSSFDRALAFLEDQPELLGRIVPSAELDRVRAFLRSGGNSSPLSSMTVEGESATVHGDLHTRNILLSQDGEVGIIDFANVKQGPPEVDVGKLMVDLALQWQAEPRDSYEDFGRIEDLVALVLRGVAEGGSASLFYSAVESQFEPDTEDSKVLLDAVIAGQIVAYLGYPDIATARKTLAVRWLAGLIMSFEAG